MKRRCAKKIRRSPMKSMDKMTRDMMKTTVGFMGAGLTIAAGGSIIHAIHEA